MIQTTNCDLTHLLTAPSTPQDERPMTTNTQVLPRSWHMATGARSQGGVSAATWFPSC